MHTQNYAELKNGKPIAILRNVSIITGIVLFILTAAFFDSIPVYARGLLAGSATLFVLVPPAFCCKFPRLLDPVQIRRDALPNSLIFWASVKEHYEISHHLLKENIHGKTKEGDTLLHLAAESGNLEKCKILRELHARVDHHGKSGRTILQAVLSEDSDVDVKARLDLVDYFCGSEGGAVELNEIGGNSQTALDFAQKLCAKDSNKYQPLYEALGLRGAKLGADA